MTQDADPRPSLLVPKLSLGTSEIRRFRTPSDPGDRTGSPGHESSHKLSQSDRTASPIDSII